jgi:hypothetical protein
MVEKGRIRGRGDREYLKKVKITINCNIAA